MNSRVKKGFGMVSCEVMRDPDISFKDKALYAYLSTYANSENNTLTVGIDRMASELNIDHSTIKRSIRKLKDLGVIERSSRGSQKSTITILLK